MVVHRYEYFDQCNAFLACVCFGSHRTNTSHEHIIAFICRVPGSKSRHLASSIQAESTRNQKHIEHVFWIFKIQIPLIHGKQYSRQNNSSQSHNSTHTPPPETDQGGVASTVRAQCVQWGCTKGPYTQFGG